jgi:hypothetical protein
MEFAVKKSFLVAGSGFLVSDDLAEAIPRNE